MRISEDESEKHTLCFQLNASSLPAESQINHLNEGFITVHI